MVEFNFEQTSEFLHPFVIKLLTPLLIVLIGLIIGKISGKLVLKALRQINLDQNFRSLTGIRFQISSFCNGLVSYFIYFVAVVLALKQLGIDTFIFNIAAIAIILLILISILLAVKDFVPNLMATILIKQKGFFKKGDTIRACKITGKVDSIGLFETKIITKDKDILIIPNHLFMKNELIKKK